MGSGSPVLAGQASKLSFTVWQHISSCFLATYTLMLFIIEDFGYLYFHVFIASNTFIHYAEVDGHKIDHLKHCLGHNLLNLAEILS